MWYRQPAWQCITVVSPPSQTLALLLQALGFCGILSVEYKHKQKTMALTSQRSKIAPHHKKIRGDHHRHSKQYLKAYHPYLPLLLIVLVGLAINIFWSSRIGVLGAATNLSATSLLTDTNQARVKGNEDQVKLSPKLSAAAQAKAQDMVSKNYWAHVSPTGVTPWNFITKSGYTYYTAGENLAYGFSNAEDAVSGWMNSSEHRANLLNPNFTEVGFGIVPAQNFHGHPNTTVIVAMYAEPAIVDANIALSSSSTNLPSDTPLRNVARIQLMTHGEAPWSVMLITLISMLAIVWFAVRHFKIWKRVFVESEEFVVQHKFLDVLIVATAVAGFILTRSAGFIH
jgi:uncharacterized protein YkwD